MTNTKRNIRKCECCGSTIAERKVTLYKGMVKALIKVYQYAKRKDIDRFQRKDIKDLLDNESQSARFGDWVMFGGLIHKEGRGKYIIHRRRCREFLRGYRKIPTVVWKDSVTKEVVEKEDYKTVDEIPGIKEFLDEEGMFQPEYRERSQKSLI